MTSSKNIIPFPNKRKNNIINNLKKPKMLFFIIISAAIIARITWYFAVERVANLDVKITPSQNITFNDEKPLAMTTAQVANQFENSDGKPILLYIYTTWCKTCLKNFDNINEIAREFQNTNLQFMALAIDRNINDEDLIKYLNKSGPLYFKPLYLAFKDGFLDFLHKRNIKYNRVIPFTVLIASDGEVITKFSGIKRQNYLRYKIIKELYNK